MEPTATFVRKTQGCLEAVAALACALLVLDGAAASAQVMVRQYDNTTPGAINYVSGAGCTAGTGSTVTRLFTVSEVFTATAIAVGLNVTHASRGQIRAYLVAPGGTVYPLITASNDNSDNYDILMSGNSDAGEPGRAPLDDGDNDPTNSPAFAGPVYNRLVTVGGLSGASGAANGTWILRVCDTASASPNGTFNRARLVLTDTTAASSVCTSRMTYDWGSNGNGADFTSFTAGDITVTETATNDYGGGRTNNGTYWNFRTDTDGLGGHTGFYSLYMDAVNVNGGKQDSETLGQRAVFGFSLPVRDLEFSSLDSDQSNGDNEDIIRVEGSAPAGGLASFSRTPASGSPVFQAAGDTIEGDAACDNGQNCATATYRFAGAVTSLIFSYFAGDDMPSEPGDQVAGISDFLFCAFDYGDAPTTYGTTLPNGPKHVLGARSLWLGATRPDGEADAQPNVAASGDDLAAIGGVDDEDGYGGLSFPACPNNGTYSVSMPVNNASGTTGYLVGYIDWDHDGTFDDSGERSTTLAVSTGTANGNRTVTWASVPARCGGTGSTYARFRFTTSRTRAESPTDGAGVYAPDGEVEDYELSDGTLPVTVAYVASATAEGSLTVRWTTATETANAGFRVWGNNAAHEWVLLAEVPSQQADSFVPLRYETTVAGAGVTEIRIEDVSLFGQRRAHPTLNVGESFGVEPEGMANDWRAIGARTGPTPVGTGVRSTSVRRRLRQVPGGARSGLLLVGEEGIQRVTYEQLLAAGIDLVGIPPAWIAILDKGAAVPRHVAAAGSTFGHGGIIEFYARPSLTLASPVDAFVLTVDRRLAIPVAPLLPGAGDLAVAAVEDRYHADKTYSFSAPNGDPWFEQGLLAWGQPASLSRAFDLPNLAPGPVHLDLSMWGYGDWPGTAPPDHHVVVTLNGSEIANESFDGITTFAPSIDVTTFVQETGNVLEVNVPGDTGYPFDYLAYDGFAVRYPRQTIAISGRFDGAVPGGGGFGIAGFVAGEPVAIWHHDGTSWRRGDQRAASGQVFLPDGGEVHAAAAAGLVTPGIAPGIPVAQADSKAEYVIVTHPAFADATGDLAALEKSRGFSTEVVTVDRIFAAYSDHASSADALKRFLLASHANGELKYVLLVGSDTTDPYDHLGLGSVSYVPTAYLPFVHYIAYSPTDETLVDADDDGVGEVPIGRLPVRTPAELAEVIAKLRAWEHNLPTSAREALLTSGASDAKISLAEINLAYASSLDAWTSTLADVDKLGTVAVRDAVLAGMNAGTPLVSFLGHSSPGQWDFSPILRWQDVAGFTNAGKPNLVAQWGCWNSYYVEPGTESLSVRLLITPDAGSAGAIGATTLTSEASHRLLGTLFFAQVNGGAGTVGEAFHNAKAELRSHDVAQDASLGMALLGDPAMSLPRRNDQ